MCSQFDERVSLLMAFPALQMLAAAASLICTAGFSSLVRLRDKLSRSTPAVNLTLPANISRFWIFFYGPNFVHIGVTASMNGQMCGKLIDRFITSTNSETHKIMEVLLTYYMSPRHLFRMSFAVTNLSRISDPACAYYLAWLQLFANSLFVRA
jgi:hypothetical protein